jgi:molybdopterin-guanine dinucleotide biosynthesis protein MobB
MHSVCIIGITGYSGSGKTTLIRRLLAKLKEAGLSVGVLKHIHHKLNIDVRGKDTDYFYRAGADFVFAHDCTQSFARYRSDDKALPDIIRRLPVALDLIIVEGHKDIDVPGFWLETGTRGQEIIKPGYSNRSVVSRGDPGYHQKALECIWEQLEKFHSKIPLNAGLLTDGKKTRSGAPETLLKIKGRSLAGRSFNILSPLAEKTVLLGPGQIPQSLNTADRLSDVPGIHGPLAGMLSAFRWSPHSAWMIASVDMPRMNKDAWDWLLGQRKPGVWAVLPRIKGRRRVETTGAVYEPMIFEHIESLAKRRNPRLQDIAKHPKVITPVIPESLAHVWRNVNTPPDREKTVPSSVRQG